MIQEELSRIIDGATKDIEGNDLTIDDGDRKHLAQAITKLFLESLPEKKELKIEYPNDYDWRSHTKEGFNQAIDQITKRWSK